MRRILQTLLLLPMTALLACAAPVGGPSGGLSPIVMPAGGAATGGDAGSGDGVSGGGSKSLAGDAASESADTTDVAAADAHSTHISNGFVAAEAQPMQVGTLAPTHDPEFHHWSVVAGEQATTCTLMPMGYKQVHLRGRIGMVVEFMDINAMTPEQAYQLPIFDTGDRLRVAYARGANDFYYKDVPLLTALPAPDGRLTMTPVTPKLTPPRVYFNFDVVTSDPGSLRFAVFDHYQVQSSPTDQPCLSQGCVDELWKEKIFNKLADVTSPDPLPPCIKMKTEMEMMEPVDTMDPVRR